MMRLFILFIVYYLYIGGVIADGNNWINPTFVLQKTNNAPNSQKKVVSYAGSSAANGPWTVEKANSVLPPSGDKRDYYSWAPYHWPNCNWCTGPRTHLTTGGNRTNTTDGNDQGYGNDNDDPTGGDNPDDGDDGSDNVSDDGQSDGAPQPLSLPVPTPNVLPRSHRRMMRRIKRFTHFGDSNRDIARVHARQLPDDSDGSIVSCGEDMDGIPVSALLPNANCPSSSDNVMNGTPTGAQNARKTQTPNAQKQPPTKTTKAATNCTPSPSKSLPPSATWTICPYVVRDGQLNPDVRLLNGVNAVADVTQSVVYNALAAVLSGSQSYAESAASFIQLFFLDSQNGVYPEVNYGQVIRGPGKLVGQYLGIIDFRAMVKVANAIGVMRAAKAPAWTSSLDSQMNNWSKQYVSWLQTSDLGKRAGSAPNNHGSFYFNQLVAMNVLLNDPSGAKVALNNYFGHQFLDQIAASGEQPFEAVRTRPYHYRCFNLEAMITNALLGDQLGLNFWTAQSKYGANIQNALDYVMKLNPGKEDITDIFPLVAAIAAAYGDPTGKYMAFLKQKDPSYITAPYYYYSQTGALTQAPAAKANKKRASEVNQEGQEHTELPPTPTMDIEEDVSGLPLTPTPTIPFECPAAFATATEVQLDDGVYVTCDELKPFYGYVDDVLNNT